MTGGMFVEGMGTKIDYFMIRDDGNVKSDQKVKEEVND